MFFSKLGGYYLFDIIKYLFFKNFLKIIFGFEILFYVIFLFIIIYLYRNCDYLDILVYYEWVFMCYVLIFIYFEIILNEK